MLGLLVLSSYCFYLFFFFQAEDGIRDRDVTGVQTCALPISNAFLFVRASTVTLNFFCARREDFLLDPGRVGAFEEPRRPRDVFLPRATDKRDRKSVV